MDLCGSISTLQKLELVLGLGLEAGLGLEELGLGLDLGLEVVLG